MSEAKRCREFIKLSFCLFVVVVIVVIFLLSYDSNLRMFMDGVFLMKRNPVSEFNKRIGLD